MRLHDKVFIDSTYLCVPSEHLSDIDDLELEPEGQGEGQGEGQAVTLATAGAELRNTWLQGLIQRRKAVAQDMASQVDIDSTIYCLYYRD